MSRTITFYKLISPYIEDITKNCSLFGNEIDDNFMNLKELSIDSVELSGTTIIIKRIGNEQLTVDLSEIIPDEPTMSVSYDEKLGKIQIDFNKETFIIDGLLNQVNSTKLFLKKVAADLTLTGNGTIQNPLTINLTHKTGMYEPAIEFLDLTSGDTLPTSGMSIGDSYVTKEVRNPFGYLYNLEGINEIKQALLAENSEWRVPTKEDWDIMLNALECDEFKNHNYTEVSVIFGKDAGKILKSREYWQESNETNAGNDTYLFSSIPSGYGDDTKLITHAYEWGEYWTDTESSDFEHYTKQFRFDETGVYQLSRNINDYFSLRLVKTYNGENLVEYEKINNAIVKTDLMPSDSGETRLVWTMEDLNFGEDNYGGLRTPLLDEITETDLFYNVWNGNIWLKRKMKEGETTVILTDSGDTSYNIYMVVNHDFIKTDLSAMDNLIQTKQEKLIAGENIVISGNVISADLNDYLKTEDASNTYETIANVNSLSDIVSGNTGDIESLEANKANTLHTHIKSEVGLSNVDNTSDLTKPISTATQTALNSKANTVHTHTKSEVGLANVDNTSDANKPISNATQTALNGKANTSHTHTKSEVGLSNVDNTSDLTKPISTATQTALNNKANTSHTHIKSEVGLANVDNTSDSAKPVSTATQTALNSKADKADTLSGYGITDAYTKTEIDINSENYKTYSGFENRADSTISIDETTGVFTLAPTTTSFNVWTNGTGKHIITTTQTVTITDDQTITYIYIDSNGTLQKSITAWNIKNGENAPCSIIFKDGTHYTITNERHSYDRNREWHNWAHNNIGTMYHHGLVGTFTNNTLSITQGVIADEDITFDTLNTKTKASLWYRNGASGMRMVRNSSTPYSLNGTTIQYDNGSGTLQPVGNNKYTCSWVYCSNDSEEPIYVVIGQNQYNTQTLALNASGPIINLSTAEWKLLYKVIYQNKSGVATYVQTVDYRTVQTGVATTPVSPTSHTGLTERDAANSHPATAISIVPPSGYTSVDVQGLNNEIITRIGITNILYADLLNLINNDELVPNLSYRITDYTTTTVQADTTSAGHNFDIIVTALSTNKLSKNAKCVRKVDDTYFENAKLEAWEIKYCIDNDTSRFAWADTVNGKGVIYYMKDEWNNECPYDFKNIQFNRKLTDGYLDEDNGVFIYVYTFTWFDENNEVKDLSLIGNDLTNDEGYKSGIFNNTIKETTSYSVYGINTSLFVLGDNVFLSNHSFEGGVFYGCFNNSFGVNCHSNTFGNSCYSNTFGNDCYYNTFGNYCYSNTFGNSCYSNTFGNDCYYNTFGDSCNSNTFGNYCDSNTFGNYCYSNKFYVGTSGTTKKDFIRYIVLEDSCRHNNFYSTLTTSGTSFLQRIRIKGLGNTATTDIQITLSEVNTKYEWVICYTSGNVLKQYCPDDL